MVTVTTNVLDADIAKTVKDVDVVPIVETIRVHAVTTADTQIVDAARIAESIRVNVTTATLTSA